MPSSTAAPTPYPAANAVLSRLLADVQTVLGERLVGLYVHGSLASGDFNCQRSDIDFVVVTTDPLPSELLPALEAMHARITASGLKWAKKLEGSYIPRRALRRYDPNDARHPALRVDGTFAVDEHGSDWVIQSHLLRQQGIALVGPPPSYLIDPVLPEALRRAALSTLRGWWVQQLHDPVRLQQREYQAYATLTMCRVLYTCRSGRVVSKPVAAGWAQETLGEPWVGLIERALAWPDGPQPDELAETLDFVRYTLERSRQFDVSPDRG